MKVTWAAVAFSQMITLPRAIKHKTTKAATMSKLRLSRVIWRHCITQS
jgi:hypothetical protein